MAEKHKSELLKLIYMEISITAFVLYVTLAFVVGGLGGYFLHSSLNGIWTRLKACGKNIRNRLVDYWYVIVFVITTIFVLWNFRACITLTFTEEFNGMNLIFLVWIVLILFPMFESFEGFGISIKKRRQDKEKEHLTANYRAQIMNVQERKEAENE